MYKKGSKDKVKFFNLGQANNFEKLLSRDLINRINNKFKNDLEKLNYE